MPDLAYKLSLLLSKVHWKNCRQRKEILRTAFVVYGFSWSAIEILSYFIPEFEQWSRGNLSMFLAVMTIGLATSLICFLRNCLKTLQVSQKLGKTDISIEIRVDDIFDIEGAYIIGTNTTFDTNMADGLISGDSLQGQFTERFYDDVKYLDVDLENELREEVYEEIENKPRGKTKQYEVGTVVRLQVKGQTTYLVAISDINEHGVAASSFEKLITSLPKLWHFIGNRGELGTLVIPVLGSGRARINNTREEIVREIIKSFITACSEHKLSEKLVIVISKDDYSKHELDLIELGFYLRHLCTYTDLQEKTDIEEGIAIS